ncbi:MAG: ABC transporter permease, partial [Chloroflexota bacterium]
LMQRLWPTLLLTGTSLIIATVGGTVIGALAARWRNTWIDHSLTSFTFFFLSVPNFWAAIIALTIFSIWLDWLPSSGMTAPGEPPTLRGVTTHLILPASVLGLSLMATIARYVRSSVIEVMSEDFIRTARAKGLHERVVFGRHALRNALLPVVTITGLRLPILIGGSVLVERVFSWPGLGRASVDAALNRDYPVTMALVMLVGTLTIVGNLIADLAYGFLDPRIRDNA